MYKVLFLGWEYYPVFTGGLGVVCTGMAEEMASQGLDIQVAVPQIPKNIKFSKVNFTNLKLTKNKTTTNYNSSKIIRTSVDLDPYSSNKQINQRHFTEEWTDLFGEYDEIEFNLDKNLYGDDLLYKVHLFKESIKDSVLDIEFDLIHAHDWMTFLAALEAKKITGKKCVLHVHATEFDRTTGNPNEIVFNIEKEMLHQADQIIAISEYNKKTLVEQYHLDPNKIHIVHNALYDEHYSDPDHKIDLGKGKTVTFLGRAVQQKGVEHFIEIARKVIDKIPNTNFIFAGDGDKLLTAMDMVNKYKLHNNFVFTGSVNRIEADILFKNTDLYLLTSISEPFGITALEAIHQGTPVVVSKSSGVSEVLPNSIKIDFWDIDKFADTVINILENEDMYSDMKTAQIKDYEKISWENQVQKIIEIYHKLT